MSGINTPKVHTASGSEGIPMGEVNLYYGRIANVTIKEVR